MDEQTKFKWDRLLSDTIERLQDARKQLDRDDVKAVDSYVDSAWGIMRELLFEVEGYGVDDNWNEKWAQQWFHGANVFNAFADSLSREPFMVEGAYRWRVRDIVKPPLKMPEDYQENAEGPEAQIVLGCNTSDVLLLVKIDNTYNKHARGSE